MFTLENRKKYTNLIVITASKIVLDQINSNLAAGSLLVYCCAAYD